MNLESLLRENIRLLKPYSCARDEFKGDAAVFLDANENPYNQPYNRYPDPLQLALKEKISAIKGVPVENIFLGNGSDEAIDVIYRIFCEPGHDNVVAIDPTYGMYKVCADINDITYRTVELNEKFDIEAYKLMDSTNQKTKVIWLCSPNNPTSNNLNYDEIIKLLQWFRGIVVVDEAYIDFSGRDSFVKLLNKFPNLIVLQTFSKAWGNAAIRLGMAFASTDIIGYMNKVKYPYNVNLLTQQHALEVAATPEKVKHWVDEILKERTELVKKLNELSIVKKVHPTDANFVLAEVQDAHSVYQELVKKGIIVRNRSNITLCRNCIRITVGTPQENAQLIAVMKLLK